MPIPIFSIIFSGHSPGSWSDSSDHVASSWLKVRKEIVRFGIDGINASLPEAKKISVKIQNCSNSERGVRGAWSDRNSCEFKLTQEGMLFRKTIGTIVAKSVSRMTSRICLSHDILTLKGPWGREIFSLDIDPIIHSASDKKNLRDALIEAQKNREFCPSP